MKRHLIFTGLLGLLLTGCVKDLDTPTVGEGDTTLPIQLYNEISQIPTTRVNDEGFCNGDGVGVYVVNYENGSKAIKPITCAMSMTNRTANGRPTKPFIFRTNIRTSILSATIHTVPRPRSKPIRSR